MRTRRLLIMLMALAALGSGALLGGSGAADGANPGRFGARVDNPWFPLLPGTTYIYVGEKNGKAARDIVRVTHRVVDIAGVPCVEVSDRLYLDGRLTERTKDWYSQDRVGNVWYFGEQTAELDKRGRVTSTEGSWKTSVDGARPGIFMPAGPQVGRAYRQEYYKGHAEDHFRIIALVDSATSPATKNVLLTKEWTPLEPGVVDHKLFVRGIGDVVEQSIEGGNERQELVSVRRGS